MAKEKNFFQKAVGRLMEMFSAPIQSAIPKGESQRVITDPTGAQRASNKMSQFVPSPTGQQQVLGAQATGTPVPTRTPTPTPMVTPTVIPQFQNVQPETQSLIKNYFTENPLEGININDLINLAAKESGLNPSRIGVNSDSSRTRDLGLFQINDKWQRPLIDQYGFSDEEMLDPMNNMKVAHEILRKRIAKGLNPYDPWYGADNLGLTSRSLDQYGE